MNAILKQLVHGTHHAAEQIACAFGLGLGLDDYVNTALQNGSFSEKNKKNN